MTAISGASLSALNIRTKQVNSDKIKKVVATITFGNGALTYPALGVPVTAALFGFRNTIQSLEFVDDSSGDGYVYKYDATNKTIRIYQANYTATAAGVLVELGSVAVAATTLVVAAEGM
jgi:hypothetical protein